MSRKKCVVGCMCKLHTHYIRTEEHKVRMREACKKRSSKLGYLERQRQAQIGKKHTYDPINYAAQNKKQSELMKEQYRLGTEWARKTLAIDSPNKLEKYVLSLVEPYGYEFVGGGSLWIGGKNPDFVNYEANKLIEVFGNYWHKPEEEQERVNHFAKYGWRCEVVWESEIKECL